MDADYAEILSYMKGNSGVYEFDESKEAGSLTEEEIIYLQAVAAGIETMGEYINEETDGIDSVTEITTIAQMIFDLECPESLGTLGDDIETSLKACGAYLYDSYNALETFFDDEEFDEYESGIMFGMLIILMARANYELAPMIETLNAIAAERNLPEDAFEALSGNIID